MINTENRFLCKNMENINHAKATVILLTAGFEIESDYPPKKLPMGSIVDGRTTFKHRNFTVVVPYDETGYPIRAMFTSHIEINPDDLNVLLKILKVQPINKTSFTSKGGYDANRDYLCEAFDDMVAREN